MSKKNILIYSAIFVLAAGIGFYIYKNENKIKNFGNNTKEQEESGDPFVKMVMPTGKDAAVIEVIQKNIDAAKKMYSELPGAWETWITIGNVRTMLEDYTGAISAYRQSIKLQSNNVQGYRNMAEVYNKNLNDYEKAQEYYMLAIENNAIDSEIYVSLALVQQFKLNNPGAAEITLLNGLRRVTDKRDVLLRLIALYKNTNQTDKQKEAEDTLSKLEEKNGEIIKTIGIQ